MKEEHVIKSLKLTSIVFGLILGLLSIFLVLNESFALFTSKTDKVTYSLKTYKVPILTTGGMFQKALRDRGYKSKITQVVFEANKDLEAIDKSIDYFDISDRQNGSVLGYMTNDETASNKYILHIAFADEKVYANSDSRRLFSADQNDNVVFSQLKEIENIEVLDTSKVTNMEKMFYDCSNFLNLDVTHFNTSNVTSMSQMFQNCSKLTDLDVTHFDTSNVKNMLGMFSACSMLTSLDLSRFNTSNVTNMQAMFTDCSNLTSLDLSNFDTSNVTNMTIMFRNCSALLNLDVTSFNTSNVILMLGMFFNCSSLSNLDITNFDTKNVTDMGSMFQNCSSLLSIDLTHFNTGKVKIMIHMFSGCSKLEEIDLSSFDTTKVIEGKEYYMFYDCSSLTTVYARTNDDASRIRGSEGFPSGATVIVKA